MRTVLYDLVSYVKTLYPDESPVPLHAPRFLGNEKQYLADCIDSTFVSYVGRYVTQFEQHIQTYTSVRHAIAMVNGTAALQMALLASGVRQEDEVVTQALTFAATAAAVRHVGARPVFVDVDRDTLGMSPDSLRHFLEEHAQKTEAGVINRATGKRIAAIVPMHTFGLVGRIDQIAAICQDWGIVLVEDSAESLGSWFGKKHTGTFGSCSILSFNGNKPVTTGGGGMVLTDDDAIAATVRHLSTTAKKKHPWEFYHDQVGWNLRMPNVNAAIGCAQMECLDQVLLSKRATASGYQRWGREHEVPVLSELTGTSSNYWLNAVLLSNRSERDEFLATSNEMGVQTRPVWTLLNKLPPYQECFHGPLENAEWLEDRIVNLPSSVRR